MIGKYSDEMTFDYIMNRMLESVPDTVDKREGSIIYDALAPSATSKTSPATTTPCAKTGCSRPTTTGSISSTGNTPV